MGRYAAQLQRLLGLPEPPGGIPFGSFRPADVPAAIADLVPRRLRELEALSRDDALSPQARRFFSDHKFHTYEDFCLLAKQSRPGKKDIIGYGDSLERGDTDLPAYLRHIRERDADFGEFLEKAQPAGIARAAFDTSVYITGGDEFRQELPRGNARLPPRPGGKRRGVGLRPTRGARPPLRGVGK